MPRKADSAKWGCLQQPCPYGHSAPGHRREKGWKEAHRIPEQKKAGGKAGVAAPIAD